MQSQWKFQHIYIGLDLITLLILRRGNSNATVLQDIKNISIVFFIRFANSIIYYALTV